MTSIRSTAAAAAIATVAACAAIALPALAADVGVSINISQPGVYGRVDIGRFPQPQVVVAQPIIVQRPVYVQQRVYEQPQPVYMWVPPGHRKNWRKHCGQYNACGVPVCFVQDQWYGQHVQPHQHDGWRDERRDGRREDSRDDRHDDERGHGKGKGKGHDKHRD